jgi:uncharacterized protein YegJ (DUF2314 family)
MASPVFWFDHSDPEMGRASEQARHTFRYFMRELSWERRRIIPAFDLAAVKAAFTQGPHTEHMWLSELDFDGTTLRGTLLNQPNQLTDVAAGDRVEVPFEERVGDWMLCMQQRVYGAYTVHLLRDRMSPRDRKGHDAAWGLPFGPPKQPLLPHAKDADDETDHPMAVNMKPSLEQALKKDAAAFLAPRDGGWTMLHDEALCGNPIVVEALLRHGADPRARTAGGTTPLALATAWRWTRVAELLRRAGAA